MVSACGGGSDAATDGNGNGGGGGAGGGGGSVAPTYTIGGSLTGLSAAELLLRNDVDATDTGGTFERLIVSTNGTFTFSTPLPADSTYEITVVGQPTDPAQECTVSNAGGTVAASDVTDVLVECVIQPLTLSASTPADRDRDVLTTVTPVLDFSAPLDESTVSTAEVTLKSDAGSHDIILDVSGSQVTVTPADPLSALTNYTLRIGTGVKGNGDASLAKAGIVEFTTVGDLPAPALGVHLRSPEVQLQPMQEIKYCYFFRTENVEELGIRKWQSHFSPHVRNMALILTSQEKQSPGSLASTNCAFLGGSSSQQEAWTYAAYAADTQMDFPLDDGAGRPIGQRLVPHQHGYLMIHFFNETSEPAFAHVELTGTAYEEGSEFTPAWTYATYNNSISIPPNSTHSETQSCNVPAELQFFRMTTHSEKQSVQTYVREGTTTVFESFDFANPGERTWLATPYYSFASGSLTYQCDYSNPTSRTITSGSSVATDEQCIAIGHVFPATKPLLCYDGLGPFEQWP